MADKKISLEGADLEDINVNIERGRLVRKLQKFEGSYITAKWDFNGEVEYASGYLQNIDMSCMQLWENRTNEKYNLENLKGFYIWD